MNYRAIIKPSNAPENWVLDCIDGDTIREFLDNVDEYMEEIKKRTIEIKNFILENN